MIHEQHAEFEALAKPLIQWLNDNGNPHMHIVITPTTAEVSEGVCAVHTLEFVKD